MDNSNKPYMKKLFNKKTQTGITSSATPIHTTDLEPTPSLLSRHKDKLIMAGLGLTVLTLFSTLIFRSSALTNQFIPLSLTSSTNTTGSVQPVPDATAAGGSYLKFVSTGGGGGSATRYEAEDAADFELLDKDCNRQILFPLLPSDSEASGGAYCGIFGATPDGVINDRIIFNVNVDRSGAYIMRVAYRNDYGGDDSAGTNRDARRWIIVNGGAPIETMLENTGPAWATKDYTITLNAGPNTIEWAVPTEGGRYFGWNDFDYIDIIPVDGSSPNPPTNPDPPNPPTDPNPPVSPSGQKCVIFLHGKGAWGFTVDSGDWISSGPNGNAEGWGQGQWLYFPEGNYQQVVNILTSAAEGCGQIVLHGFSNGAAAAAKVYCRGETFNGRLVGVIVDDPVTDHAVEGCSPASGVKAVIYWTGSLEFFPPGSNCASDDWTCEGGSIIGIVAYASAMGAPYKQSINGGHSPYPNPPELFEWW